MSMLTKAYIRTFQYIMMNGQKLLNYGVPMLIQGPHSITELPTIIKEMKINKILIVAGKTIARNGIMNDFLGALDAEGVDYEIFDGAEPNPSIENIEDTCNAFKNGNCQGIVAFGGGSSIDCAKVGAARITNPNITVEKMGGLLKVAKKIPPFFAIPTTAGTGSETTIAAVVTNKRDKHKYSVTDPKLLPIYAVLDPELTIGLPSQITAMTGMDALTHAIEAYTNKFGSKYAYKNAENAVKLIFDNLLTSYKNGDNIYAREKMLEASFFAGVAFTRNCVGYVHALGHALGGMYGIPHGQAMAVILPKVMRKFDKAAYKRLAKLANFVGVPGDSEKEKALNFIKKIEEMNQEMGIPKGFDCIKDEDIDKMTRFAVVEAIPLYPTPAVWDKKDFEEVYRNLKI